MSLKMGIALLLSFALRAQALQWEQREANEDAWARSLQERVEADMTRLAKSGALDLENLPQHLVRTEDINVSRSATWNASRNATGNVTVKKVVRMRPAPPQKAGCYVWAPSGCKSKNISYSSWTRATRDPWHDTKDKYVCLNEKRQHYRTACNKSDVEMLFLRESAPPPPTEPGCYIWTPSGCPNGTWSKSKWDEPYTTTGYKWMHDTWGELLGFAKERMANCVDWRRTHFNQLCGVDDVRAYYIPETNASELLGSYAAGPYLWKPNEYGCWVVTPWGCPGKPSWAHTKHWERDTHFEETLNFGEPGSIMTSADACLARGKTFSEMCGGIGAKMAYVSKEGDLEEGETCMNEPDSTCQAAIKFAMSEAGIYQHPEWYPGLTTDSKVPEFQKFLQNQSKCPAPCFE